tara:strand:- start:903 stop:1769 length:867 start_codon:yes stop_codon:yes gene_type:complete
MNFKTLSSHKNQDPESSFLYIVGTPIGNLNDLSFRAVNILKNVSLIACEDTRQTKKILHKFDFNNKLISFNKHNSIKKVPQIINYLKNGKSIALVSDAGMPSICDPGEDLVKDAKLNGIDVICIPGPCAALTALVTSGLPSSKFTFEGFLPKKKSERNKLLLKIVKSDKTTILFESPHRLKKLLDELKEYCGGEREIQVSRELTKKYEEHIGNNINEVINHFQNKEVLGEFTIVIKGKNILNKDSVIDNNELRKELNELIEAGLSLSSASRYLAKKKNVSKNYIYSLY